MTLNIIRVIFTLLSVALSYNLAPKFGILPPSSLIIGLGGSLLIIGLEILFRKVSLRSLLAGAFGLFLGLVAANLIAYSFRGIGLSEAVYFTSYIGLCLALAYLGSVMVLRRKEEFHGLPYSRYSPSKQDEEYKILDSSVIIDGRIADICETGFLEGTLIIPRFILQEVQKIADSADSLKRNRGRRGLDVLGKIEKNAKVKVRIDEQDFPEVKEVDEKLVRLGKEMTAKVLTNDYSLNKVASLEKVSVLNINELANALKPVVLPGEIMKVRVVKEGKEPGQGVAYLDDGTMVVIDNGKDYVGRNIDAVVTSVLQTTAGRMVFTRPSGEGNERTREPYRTGRRNAHQFY